MQLSDFAYVGVTNTRDLASVAALGARLRVVDVLAVWTVESNASMADRHGRLIYRFEPHLFFRERFTWRDSLRMAETERRRLLEDALAADPERCVGSMSWGAGQILGLHFRRLGYPTALAMVQAWCADGYVYARDFVRFLQISGLDVPLRLGDLLTFARGYNGRGQPAVYAEKLRRAYTRLGGEPAAVALSIGSRGAAVEAVQRALSVPVDGFYGPFTQAAVEDFQRARALVVDGIVGPETWSRLFPTDGAEPELVRSDQAGTAGAVSPVSGLNVGAVIGLAGAASEVPGLAGQVLGWVMVGAGAAMVALALFVLWRRHLRG